jgi:hypothetical protein
MLLMNQTNKFKENKSNHFSLKKIYKFLKRKEADLDMNALEKLITFSYSLPKKSLDHFSLHNGFSMIVKSTIIISALKWLVPIIYQKIPQLKT